MPWIKERNLEMEQVNFVASTKTDDREIAVLYGSLVDLEREDILECKIDFRFLAHHERPLVKI